MYFFTLFPFRIFPNKFRCYRDSKFSKLFPLNLSSLQSVFIPTVTLILVFVTIKILPCLKSVVWGWINVLKKYWRNVPLIVRSNPSADMRFPSCPLTSMSVSILSYIHTKKSIRPPEVSRKCRITWKIIKIIYFTVTKKILENRILKIKFKGGGCHKCDIWHKRLKPW